MKETLNIETYSLFEFCQKVQESILQGWKFDFESNANFPTMFGSMLVCGMVKSSEQEDDKVKDGVPEVKIEVVPEEVKEEQPKKVGRKSLASLGSSSKAKVIE